MFAADARASAQRRPIPDEEDVPDMRPSDVQRSTDVSKASEHGSDTENHASIRGTHVFVCCVDQATFLYLNDPSHMFLQVRP